MSNTENIYMQIKFSQKNMVINQQKTIKETKKTWGGMRQDQAGVQSGQTEITVKEFIFSIFHLVACLQRMQNSAFLRYITCSSNIYERLLLGLKEKSLRYNLQQICLAAYAYLFRFFLPAHTDISCSWKTSTFSLNSFKNMVQNADLVSSWKESRSKASIGCLHLVTETEKAAPLEARPETEVLG